MQVDGRKVGKGEHPEGESGHSGDAVLSQLYCAICWIRTRGGQGNMVTVTMLPGGLVVVEKMAKVRRLYLSFSQSVRGSCEG